MSTRRVPRFLIGEAVAVVYNDGTSDIAKIGEPRRNTLPMLCPLLTGELLSPGVSLRLKATDAIVPETGGTDLSKRSRVRMTWVPLQPLEPGDVSNIGKSDVDTIFGASGTGVTVGSVNSGTSNSDLATASDAE